MKKKLINIIISIIFITGVGFILYPTLSDYINKIKHDKLIEEYQETVSNNTYQDVLEKAKEYNQEIGNNTKWELDEDETIKYNNCLNIDNNGIMGYIEIAKINVSLPIYHGTSESVLQVGVGHLAGSSLPIGGDSTHCVLSGHRGLPSAKLFTDLDQLEKGDTFMLKTLDMSLTYEIDQIVIVDPTDFSKLKIEDGKDYCSLVTCTPYGINTHRLIIRGHRIENKDIIEETSYSIYYLLLFIIVLIIVRFVLKKR